MIRWKSQYYDNDSGLYYISGRWYDPERGRFISSASPEIMLQTVADAFNLNLYAFGVNPVGIVLSCGSIYPSLDFYYDGTYKTWWDKWGKYCFLAYVIKKAITNTVAACILAVMTCGEGSPLVAITLTLYGILIGTIIGTTVCLAIYGIISGIQSKKRGHGFWDGFADAVEANFVEVLIINFYYASLRAVVGNALQCVQCFKEGTLVETEEGAKPIEEIQVGDKVLAYDEETGEQAYKPVVRLFRNESKEWVRVTVKGEEIESTPGHQWKASINKNRKKQPIFSFADMV